MHMLSNAAQEFIELAIARIRANPLRSDAQTALASVLREQADIEEEIGQLADLLAAAGQIAQMKQPSIEHLLRHRGFGFEADRIADLVLAIDAIDGKNAALDAD